MQAEIEALLMGGHGLTIQDMTSLSDGKRNEVLEAIDVIEDEYSKDFHGVELKNVGGKYSFFTKVEYAETISKIRKKAVNEITNSQMEVLAIIAYNQPLILKEIEKFRGSACSNQARELISMGLVRRKRDKTQKGNPYMYVTTENFLKVLGIPDISYLKEGIVENTEVSEKLRDSIAPES